MRFVKRDVVLWLKHLQEAGVRVPQGRSAVFRVSDADILFQPMRPGASGRPTPGLRAAGANRAVWSSIPLGTAIDLELVRVLAEDTAAPLADVGKPRLSRTYKAASHRPSGAVNESFEAVALPPLRSPAFDAYIMVDWSAASGPKTGKDSVWWCLCVWRCGRLVVEANENAPTRQTCFDALRDRHARGAQPVWKLWGNGSVGGQTLLGVPMLARLRDDDHLRAHSAVWPFETGCRLPPRDEPRIIFAEIYPSLVKVPADFGGRVKDSAQVEAIARHLVCHDASDTLNGLFAAPATLEPFTEWNALSAAGSDEREESAASRTRTPFHS